MEQSRRIELQGAAETDQIARLEAAGFQKTNTASILAIRKQYIPQDELDRCDSLAHIYSQRRS